MDSCGSGVPALGGRRGFPGPGLADIETQYSTHGTTKHENPVHIVGKRLPDGCPRFRRRGSPPHLV